MENKKKGAIYLRLSKDDKENPSLSPEHQKQICQNKADKDGVDIVDNYKDINRTGSNILRPELQRLLNDAEQKKFQFLYIKDWSRLSRDIIDQETIVKSFIRLKIEIISVDGVQDSKARQVVGLSNQWYYDECKKKQEQIHELKIKENVPLNRPPIGYKMNKKKKVFEVAEKEAQIVRRIFELKISGLNLNQVAKEVDFGLNTVKHILRNKTYLGYNIYKEQLIKGKHSPIISEEDFNIVNSERILKKGG